MNGESFEALARRAQMALADREFKRAHALATDMLHQKPDCADAFFLLSRIAAEHDNHAGALEVLLRALRLDDANPRFHAFFARSLVALNRPDEAVAAASRAAELEPRDALTLDTIGVVFSRTGNHARAVPLFEQATARAPDVAPYHYNLGSAQQFLGRFDAAEAAFERCLARDPDHVRAHSAVSHIRPQVGAPDRIRRLTSAWDRLHEDADAALNLGHALAREYEELGQYELAFDWLERAKRGKALAVKHDPAGDRALFRAAREAAPRARDIGDRRHEAGGLPVFVVGMPRTGTTLVDRILSSHPHAVSLGESTRFALLIKQATQTQSRYVLDAQTLGRARHVDLHGVGGAYLAATRRLAGTARVFIDKMPLNFLYAGLVVAAIPNARVICLRRDPMDACLANYRQLFSTSYTYYNYALDLAHTAGYYVAFERLIGHWRQTLPADRFVEVAYEAVVADLEHEARGLVAFCGLDWHDACLDFHRNPAPVATASSVQVRKPIYATSVGRWRRYGNRLVPLRDTLAAAGLSGTD